MKKVCYRDSEGGWYLTIRENGRRKQLLLLKGPNTRDTPREAETLAIQEPSNRQHQEAVSNHFMEGGARET